jgi:hypothetical protein
MNTFIVFIVEFSSSSSCSRSPSWGEDGRELTPGSPERWDYRYPHGFCRNPVDWQTLQAISVKQFVLSELAEGVYHKPFFRKLS